MRRRLDRCRAGRWFRTPNRPRASARRPPPKNRHSSRMLRRRVPQPHLHCPPGCPRSRRLPPYRLPLSRLPPAHFPPALRKRRRRARFHRSQNNPRANQGRRRQQPPARRSSSMSEWRRRCERGQRSFRIAGTFTSAQPRRDHHAHEATITVRVGVARALAHAPGGASFGETGRVRESGASLTANRFSTSWVISRVGCAGAFGDERRFTPRSARTFLSRSASEGREGNHDGGHSPRRTNLFFLAFHSMVLKIGAARDDHLIRLATTSSKPGNACSTITSAAAEPATPASGTRLIPPPPVPPASEVCGVASSPPQAT
jgi:hypothetical protein